VKVAAEKVAANAPDYLTEHDPFADFIVHEAAHIFHNCKRWKVILSACA